MSYIIESIASWSSAMNRELSLGRPIACRDKACICNWIRNDPLEIECHTGEHSNIAELSLTRLQPQTRFSGESKIRLPTNISEELRILLTCRRELVIWKVVE